MQGEKLHTQDESGSSEPAVSRFALVTLLLAPVIALALVLGFTRSSMKEAALAPEEFWGGALPPSVNTIHTFRTVDGMIGEFEHPSSGSEIRIVVVPTPLQQSVEGFLGALKQGDTSDYPTLFGRYTKAFLNPRRTGQIHTVQMEMAGQRVLIEQVEGLKGWYYSVALLRGATEVVEILTIKKEAVTPPQAIREVVEQSPRLRAIVRTE